MLQVLLCFSLLAGKCYRYFYISLCLRLASKCYITGIFLCFTLLTAIFYVSHSLHGCLYIYILSSTNLKDYPHIYTNKRLIFYMYVLIIFEIAIIKIDIHVGKVKHNNNCNFYLLYLTRTSSVRLIAIKLHSYVLKKFYYH